MRWRLPVPFSFGLGVWSYKLKFFLRSNWAKLNILGGEDHSFCGEGIEPFQDRGRARSESGGSHLRCPKTTCLVSIYSSRKLWVSQRSVMSAGSN